MIDLWLESTFQLFPYSSEYELGQYSQISLYLTHLGVKNGGFEPMVSIVSRFLHVIDTIWSLLIAKVTYLLSSVMSVYFRSPWLY